MESLGASFSNLIAEAIADFIGYDIAFSFLSVAGLFPMLLYFFHMPDYLQSILVEYDQEHQNDTSSSAHDSSVSSHNLNVLQACRNPIISPPKRNLSQI